MIEEPIAELQSLAGACRVNWHIAEPLPPLWGDAFLLQAATRNLLSNAMKYSRTRGAPQVRITAVVRPGAVGLQISDNGAGFEQK